MQDQWTFAVWFSNSFSGKLVSLVTLSADFPRAKKMHSHAEDGCTKFCFCIFAKKIPASRNKNVHIFSLANFKIISLKFCLSEIWFNAVSLPSKINSFRISYFNFTCKYDMIRFRLTLAYRKRHLIPRWVKTKMCPHTFKLSVPIIWIGYDKAMNKIQISKFSTRFLTWILG